MIIDNGGITLQLKTDVELRANVDWNELYNMIKESSCIDIATYSQYEAEDFWERLKHHPNVHIIINGKSLYNECRARGFIENNKTHTVDKVETSHAKMILAAPDVVCLSSQNVGSADWLQNTVIFHDEIAYEFYKKEFDQYAIDGWINNFKYTDTSFDKMPKMIAEEGSDTSWGKSIILHKPKVKLEKMLNWKTKVMGIWYKDVLISSYTLPNEKYVKDTLRHLLKRGNHITFVINAASARKLQKIRKELAEELEETFLDEVQQGKFFLAAMRLEQIIKNGELFDIEVRTNVHAKVLLASKDQVNGGGEEVVWLSSQNFGSSGWFENMVGIYGAEAYNFYKEIFEDFLQTTI